MSTEKKPSTGKPPQRDNVVMDFYNDIETGGEEIRSMLLLLINNLSSTDAKQCSKTAVFYVIARIKESVDEWIERANNFDHSSRIKKSSNLNDFIENQAMGGNRAAEALTVLMDVYGMATPPCLDNKAVVAMLESIFLDITKIINLARAAQ